MKHVVQPPGILQAYDPTNGPLPPEPISYHRLKPDGRLRLYVDELNTMYECRMVDRKLKVYTPEDVEFWSE